MKLTIRRIAYMNLPYEDREKFLPFCVLYDEPQITLLQEGCPIDASKNMVDITTDVLPSPSISNSPPKISCFLPAMRITSFGQWCSIWYFVLLLGSSRVFFVSCFYLRISVLPLETGLLRLFPDRIGFSHRPTVLADFPVVFVILCPTHYDKPLFFVGLYGQCIIVLILSVFLIDGLCP